ncbi:MAG: hypothetical protein DRG63_10195 [Deltaproteobacteria bacterium]|nr:MAG: hypothetical protein DRG63_10195 [Deltaproteobacteria bacterium]
MPKLKREFLCSVLQGTMAMLLILVSPAHALPSLQVGPGSTGTWTYNSSSETWIVEENSFELNAYANAIDDNSQYAWGSSLDASQTAYLVAAAVPTTANNTDVFEITVQNDGLVLTLDPNSYG